MATVIPDRISRGEKLGHDDAESGVNKEDELHSIPPLGKPREEKKFWFQRGNGYDPDAIATQVWNEGP